MLSSLEIKNFRTFSHLVIERLGRVNLIVGKNNVGKTTLLEALRILGSASARSVRSILEDRNEVRPSGDLGVSGQPVPHYLLESLVHGRDGSNLEFGLCVFTEDGKDYKACGRLGLDTTISRILGMEFPRQSWFMRADGSTGSTSQDIDPSASLPIEAPYLRGDSSGHETENMVASWWDASWLSEGKKRVLKLLSMLAPVEDVIFTSDPRHPNDRLAMARVTGFADPLPLAAVGNGLQRLFHIALAMEHATHRADKITQASSRPRDVSAFLLIDEVEAGIHHTLHAALWRFVLDAARLLDVQVFATTHSQDCLRGFAEAVAEDEEADGLVIRLEQLEGQEATRAVTFDRTDLPIVLRDSIEVR